MTSLVHFSGTLTGDNGPAVVNRSYWNRRTGWMRECPPGPTMANTWAFLRRHRQTTAVLVSGTSFHHVLLVLAARALRRPAWVLAHGVARVEMQINGTWSIKHTAAEWLTLTLATNVVAVSDRLRRQIEREYPRVKPAAVVYNAPPESVVASPGGYVEPPAQSEIRIMTVGAMPIKNLDVLCDAIDSADLGSVELIVVGVGSGAETLNRAYVRHHPRLPHSEVLEWMASSHLYVQISSHESFGLAVCEAAEQGCELLLSEQTGCVTVLPTLGPDNLVSDPRNPAEVASRLMTLAERIRAGAAETHLCTRTWDEAVSELRAVLCDA